MHLFPTNPYPHPPPPPIAHKVWILDCKSCNSFLTNRAMKAVLLLRPNVSLFSSDALPVNCSAYSANPEALRCRSPCRPTSANVPPRTCECLTQTLCCHGCGSTIGYMIVIPCTRCTSSISATNRATNGHRFVFHSSEVVGTERHYIQDEPGVIPFEPTGVVSTSSPPSDSTSRETSRSNRTNSPSRNAERIPTPPLEQANPLVVAATSPPDSFVPPPNPRSSNNRHTRTTAPAINISTSVEPKDMPTSRALKAGDVLFWHHLTRCGEIPGVEDDKRARSKTCPRVKTSGDENGNNKERRGRSLGNVLYGR